MEIIRSLRCLMLLLLLACSHSPALAQSGQKAGATALLHSRKAQTLAFPEQIHTGMTFSQFEAAINQSMGKANIRHEEDEEKMMVQVDDLHIFFLGYGDLINPDFIFMKTSNGLLLAVIQEDVTHLSKTVLTKKIAALMYAYGKPRVSQATDGSNLVSSTWPNTPEKSMILSVYRSPDTHQFFLIGNVDLSPIAATL